MDETTDEILKNTPPITTFPVLMDEVNQPILIYKGGFQLKHGDKIISVIGKVFMIGFQHSDQSFQVKQQIPLSLKYSLYLINLANQN
ncbi:hypothetical protein [Adhaeribacter pallidiroseus]|uniref:Uncharacterized protein n=1 Tax=Adhaeribacter pallidiroseus TaxID=2072847 RepID=A0A369QLA4_9BACT|nr:hypothetical protein [Adhaeribacter pallidiroseus]RDC64027.1 hypothetical protein AHMF7616_02637 [Adhaeribacter pallidiroseus]